MTKKYVCTEKDFKRLQKPINQIRPVLMPWWNVQALVFPPRQVTNWAQDMKCGEQVGFSGLKRNQFCLVGWRGFFAILNFVGTGRVPLPDFRKFSYSSAGWDHLLSCVSRAVRSWSGWPFLSAASSSSSSSASSVIRSSRKWPGKPGISPRLRRPSSSASSYRKVGEFFFKTLISQFCKHYCIL